VQNKKRVDCKYWTVSTNTCRRVSSGWCWVQTLEISSYITCRLVKKLRRIIVTILPSHTPNHLKCVYPIVNFYEADFA